MRIHSFPSLASLLVPCLAGGLAALPVATAGAQGAVEIEGATAGYSLTAPAPAPSRPRPAGQIEDAARRFAPAVRHCYQEEGLKQDPALSGDLRVAMTVAPGGDVRTARVTVTGARGVGMRAVVSCVTAAAGSWHFAPGPFRQERVRLSFRLHASD